MKPHVNPSLTNVDIGWGMIRDSKMYCRAKELIVVHQTWTLAVSHYKKFSRSLRLVAMHDILAID